MKNELQIYRIKGGLGPQGNRQEIDEEPLLPTDFGTLRPIHPDEAMEILLPNGVGRSGSQTDEKRERPPLMDS